MVGRITLASSVLNTISVFQMQLMKLPTALNKSLDKLCRRCIWGETDDQRKLHLVHWDVIC